MQTSHNGLNEGLILMVNKQIFELVNIERGLDFDILVKMMEGRLNLGTSDKSLWWRG